MKNMYVQEIQFGTPQYDEMVRLRDKILRQPLGLEFKPEDFTTEYLDTHLCCYDEQARLCACLVLTAKEDGQIKMRQVAVDDTCQSKGIGSLLVKASEVVAKDKGFTEMVLNARDVALDFYLKLDYQKVGKPFTEVTIKLSLIHI